MKDEEAKVEAVNKPAAGALVTQKMPLSVARKGKKKVRLESCGWTLPGGLQHGEHCFFSVLL